MDRHRPPAEGGRLADFLLVLGGTPIDDVALQVGAAVDDLERNADQLGRVIAETRSPLWRLRLLDTEDLLDCTAHAGSHLSVGGDDPLLEIP